MIAAKIANSKGGGYRRVTAGIPAVNEITNERAAKLLNVGKEGVSDARTVLARGTPEQVAAVERGEAAVSTFLWGTNRST